MKKFRYPSDFKLAVNAKKDFLLIRYATAMLFIMQNIHSHRINSQYVLVENIREKQYSLTNSSKLHRLMLLCSQFLFKYF